MPYTDQSAPHAGSAEVLFTSLFDEPAGSLARTIPRWGVGSGNVALSTTGIPVCKLIANGLPAGLPVANLAWLSGTTAEVAGSHFWMALMDVNSNVLAVTADQTGASYVTASAFLKNPVTVPILVPQTGNYYIVVSVSAATTMPTSAGSNLAAGMSAQAPVHSGTLGAQAAPPAVGANLGAISQGNFGIAAWIS